MDSNINNINENSSSMEVEELELSSNEIFLYDIDFSLCRLCVQNLGSIEFLTNKILCEQVQLFTNIDLKYNNEKLPKYLCENCNQLLKDFHIFQQNCIQINERLIELITSKNEEENSEDIKPLVDTKFFNKNDDELIHEQEFIIIKYDEESQIVDEQIEDGDEIENDINYEIEHLDYSDLENSKNDCDEISKNVQNDTNDGDDEDTECHKNNTLHYICPECNKFYTQKRSLKRHVQSVHPDKPDIWQRVNAFKKCLCIECHKSFPDKKKLKRHVLMEHPDKPHIWQLSEVNDRDQYKQRMGEKYTCNACGKSYTEIRSLKRHVMSKHSDTPDIWKQARISIMAKRIRRKGNAEHMFHCDTCGNTYLYFRSLRRHAIQSHGIKLTISESEKSKVNFDSKNCKFDRNSFVCKEIIDSTTNGRIGAKYTCTVDNCDAIFSNKENFYQHKYKEHNIKEYLCQKCGKSFRNIRNLESHETFHLNIMPYKCPKCDSHFRFTNNLKIHIRNHHEGHRYYCSKCGRGFLTNCTRKRHELIHDGIKNFKCDECSAAFYTLKELKGHKRYHSDIRPHFCTICYKTFVTKTVLRIHMRSHTGEKPFKCLINGCMKSFAEKTKLYRHKRNIHHVNPQTS